MQPVGPVDVLVVGAGPVGIACAIEAQRVGLTARIIEKGAVVNSLTGYPTNMRFFSTPELLEIGDHPFPSRGYKPLREDAIDYYRRVLQREALDVRLYERVVDVDGEAGRFVVHTQSETSSREDQREEQRDNQPDDQPDDQPHVARFVVIATGFFDQYVPLNVPGEDLPHVHHYYREPYRWALRNVVVIGAKNSAAIAALDCHRNGANVTMLIRGGHVSDSVKYWIKPDLENRIREGQIRAFFNTRVTTIDRHRVHFDGPAGAGTVSGDVVLALTGYRPDYSFLRQAGIDIADDDAATPVHDEHTFETNRGGIYLAGTVCGGNNTSRWFIENGRHHARQIAAHIAARAER